MKLTPEQIERIQPELPSPARVYDYLLGGAHNFPSDQAAAQQMLAWLPNLPDLAQANRRFLKRAVTYLLDQGIDQFLDIGAGIPTQGNVHEIVRDRQASARVVYMDNDPIAVMHGSFIIGNSATVRVIDADLTDVAHIAPLGHTHLNVLGRYHFEEVDPTLQPGTLRPLRPMPQDRP